MSHPTSSIQRFSSRAGRLSHVFLKDRLAGAKTYRRIAGYFRSSIFELVGIDSIEIVCNSDLDRGADSIQPHQERAAGVM